MNEDLGATLVGGECSYHYTTLAPQLGTNHGRREKFRGRSRALYNKNPKMLTKTTRRRPGRLFLWKKVISTQI